jgi:hypothetical protein
MDQSDQNFLRDEVNELDLNDIENGGFSIRKRL